MIKQRFIKVLDTNVLFTASNFKTCIRNSPQFANCVTGAIERLRPEMTVGNFGNNILTESLSPLNIGDVTTQKSFNMKLFALKVFGLEKFKIDKLRINTENFKVTFNETF